MTKQPTLPGVEHPEPQPGVRRHDPPARPIPQLERDKRILGLLNLVPWPLNAVQIGAKCYLDPLLTPKDLDRLERCGLVEQEGTLWKLRRKR